MSVKQFENCYHFIYFSILITLESSKFNTLVNPQLLHIVLCFIISFINSGLSQFPQLGLVDIESFIIVDTVALHSMTFHSEYCSA